MKSFRSYFGGQTYDIPKAELNKLTDFIKDVWIPELERGLCGEQGIKRVPTNIRALSFTIFLKEWYRNNFQKYKVIHES